MLSIKVLGSGCANCHKVEELAKQAVAHLGVEAKVEMVTEMKEIKHYYKAGIPSREGIEK